VSVNRRWRRQVGVIDAHVHLRGFKHVPAEAMRRTGLCQVININYLSSGNAEAVRGFAADLDRDSERCPGAFLSCTTFPLAGFGEPGFAEAAIDCIAERLASHPETVAVKLWKNVGLELRDRLGQLVQCDDPRFSPVFAWLAERDIPVYLHIGDPIAAWRPLDPADSHFDYYNRNPQYQFHGKAGVPDHAALIAAQNRLVARWPHLRFIAAHLAAQAHDVGLVASFLRDHPNVAVDSSARHTELRGQNREKVRALFLEFPDRILFGSDWSARYNPPDPVTDEAAISDVCGRIEWDFAFFEEDLALPEPVLRRFYRENARAWLGLDARAGASVVLHA
jgi:predicted TIM-barrel fold metal-dependent hydrolase